MSIIREQKQKNNRCSNYLEMKMNKYCLNMTRQCDFTIEEMRVIDRNRFERYRTTTRDVY